MYSAEVLALLEAGRGAQGLGVLGFASVSPSRSRFVQISARGSRFGYTCILEALPIECLWLKGAPLIKQLPSTLKSLVAARPSIHILILTQL